MPGGPHCLWGPWSGGDVGAGSHPRARGAPGPADVDECRRSPRPCTHGRCENTVGGFRCACDPGYRADPAGTRCLGETARGWGGPRELVGGHARRLLTASLVPADVDECAQSPRPCTHGRCENTPGSYRCACPAGYRANAAGTSCSGSAWQGRGVGRSRARSSPPRCPQTSTSAPGAPGPAPPGAARTRPAATAAPAPPATSPALAPPSAWVRDPPSPPQGRRSPGRGYPQPCLYL